MILNLGQDPPVMDLPMYTTMSSSELSHLSSANYHLFDYVELVMRQAGHEDDQ